MSTNNDEESKADVGEGKKIKNTPKRKKFRSFSLGKCLKTTLSIVYWLSFNIESEISQLFESVEYCVKRLFDSLYALVIS